MTDRKGSAMLFVVLIALLSGCASRRYDLSRSSTQVNVGVRAAQSNLWREALFRFQRAVQIDPADAMALNNLAVAYEGTGEWDKARAAYVEALRLDRSNQYIQKNYSRFVEFTSKNKKRQVEPATTAKSDPGSTVTPPALSAPPVDTPPPTVPPTLEPPRRENEPPTEPAKSPASTNPGGSL